MMNIIAHIHNDYKEKFGIPRQSGLVKEVESRIVFEPEYRDVNAVRGLEGFSHIWLIWQFSEHMGKEWSPTVRPPRLGGNKRVGVFATRSPFRPNPMGLSSVRLNRIDITKEGPVLYVSGADLLDGTPIYDIKPYLAYVDSHPAAVDGFAGDFADYRLQVVIPEEIEKVIPMQYRQEIRAILEQDPRPGYQEDADKIYGMKYADLDIRFRVEKRIINVCACTKGDM